MQSIRSHLWPPIYTKKERRKTVGYLFYTAYVTLKEQSRGNYPSLWTGNGTGTGPQMYQWYEAPVKALK